ncbi:SCP2 sterol-binding domain-containing protein [Caldifermentibacillus hisashii]|uniref:SCP2 sterol-binding domain-containing protein n=1 Tax=Caldifermentibacillus hisashii TaxID=996558 RepID=UPI0034D64189
MSEQVTNASQAEIKQYIEKELNENPAPIADVNVVYQFDLTGDEEDSFQLQLNGGQAKVVPTSETTADCTLVMSADSFRKFLTGKLSGTVAFMTGKLKIKGELAKAMKLEQILKQYNLNG